MSSATLSRNKSNEIEENEHDIVLGNKQLLSVFFIVVVLLGVFFTMGYVMGRNSTPVEAKQADPYDRQNAQSTIPAESSPTRLEVAREQAVSPSDPVPEPVQPVRPPVDLPQVTVSQPAVGRLYLQVLAVAKAEAEVLVEVLSKKGFRALVAPGPNDKVFRVLVGPARDPSDASRLKSDLESAGFKPFLKKY